MKTKLLSLLLVAGMFAISCSKDDAGPLAEVASDEMVALKAAGDCGWDGGYPICCDPNADSDGDGWGWQWNRSCKMPAGGGCGTAPNGYPYCCSSSSDPDGDGWGWENGQSCVVQSGGGGGGSSAGDCGWDGGYPICCDSNADPDGDGWGWQWNRSCKMSGGGGGGGGGGNGSCPGSLSCPSGMNCGCYQVSGLGSNKVALTNAGGDLYDMAAAMMETEKMNTNYTYGDGKTGDAFNAGVCKQNWLMMRNAHAAWRHLGANDYHTGAQLNNNRSLDMQVLNESQGYYGSQWWAGHRAGWSGLNGNWSQTDINNFKRAMDWTYNRLNSNSSYRTDNTRFWVQVPAV